MNNTVQIPAPLVHQLPILDDGARYKVARCGRRFGKTRLDFIAAIVGHGPVVDGEPLYRGIAQGVDIVWLAPDFPQARAIWREEIEPRFSGVQNCELNRQERRLTLKGGGNLEIRSAEAIDGIRGRKLGGVIIDEAAWLDLEYAWKEVILPALLDLAGWALITSTPNAGPDGWQDVEGKRTPSYFNLLCERIEAGEMGPQWKHWHRPTHANPTLKPDEIEALIAEYPPDSPALQQEIYAKLIAAGAGVAFPEWDDAVHVTTTQPEETGGAWRWAAGMDWGYTAPGWFGLFASSPERSVLRFEHYFREQSPYQVGYTLGKTLMRYPPPEWIALDSAAWAVTDGGPTVAEEIQRGLKDACGKTVPPVIAAPKGPGSRISGKLLLHDVLRHKKPKEGEALKQWERPKLLVHESCENVIRTLPRLPRDEKNPEDVDTHAEDHPYDGIRYWLMARTPQVEREEHAGWSEDKHPGFTKSGQRARPWAVDENEDVGPRWRRSPAGITSEEPGGYGWD